MPTLFDNHAEFNDWFAKNIESYADSKSSIDESEWLAVGFLIFRLFMKTGKNLTLPGIPGQNRDFNHNTQEAKQLKSTEKVHWRLICSPSLQSLRRKLRSFTKSSLTVGEFGG